MANTCTETRCDGPAYGRGLCAPHYRKARSAGTLPEAPPVRQCPECGNEFSSRKWNAVLCSRRCNDAAHVKRQRAKVEATREVKACKQCGVNLAGLRLDATFCSTSCSTTWRNARTGEALLASKAALNRTCTGCGGPIPPARRGNALYCSPTCKSTSRRHQAYGLTKAELDLLLSQHEQCAICGTSDWGERGPQVDHCHLMGPVRGILCSNCNQGLGRFRDSPDLLRAAAAYIDTHALADHVVLQE